MRYINALNFSPRRTLSALLLGLASTTTALPSTGMAAIGFSAFSSPDVTQSVNVFRSCPASRACELAFLSYSFGGYENAETFTKALLPYYTHGETLVMTIYLDDGANRDDNYGFCRFRGDLSAQRFWALVKGNDSTLKQQWRSQRVTPAANFINSMTAWANSQRIENRLKFVVIPVLEDGYHGTDIAGSAYVTLLAWTKDLLPATVGYRRNSTDVNAPRISGLPMEFHKDQAHVTDLSHMISYDTLTDDGDTAITDTQWIAAQKNALNHSISGLFWWQSFNGNRALAPWLRAPLRPFTTDPNTVSRAKVIIASRPD